MPCSYLKTHCHSLSYDNPRLRLMIHPRLSLKIHPRLCLMIHPHFCLMIHPRLCLMIHPRLCLMIHPRLCLMVHPRLCLMIHPPFCLMIHPRLCLMTPTSWIIWFSLFIIRVNVYQNRFVVWEIPQTTGGFAPVVWGICPCGLGD